MIGCEESRVSLLVMGFVATGGYQSNEVELPSAEMFSGALLHRINTKGNLD